MVATTPADDTLDAAPPRRRMTAFEFVRRHPTMVAGIVLLLAMVATAVLAPYLGTVDPLRINPIRRLRPPSEIYWFGTDQFGRDVWSRVIYGTRVSLLVGAAVAIIATLAGLAIGLVAGYNRLVDSIVMRVMDGLMAIPAILLAIALMALTKSSVRNVIIAIAIAEIPRVTRLVRGVVLQVRENVYVQAAVAVGTPTPKILVRHILPNTLAPLIVQATYICAAAVITEAALSFLGAGTPPDVPSWGSIMAEGRTFFQIAYWNILFPGIFLSLTVLAINLVGDGLRDLLDPRLARRM
jgi:peptide/nickel transport system permease protein